MTLPPRSKADRPGVDAGDDSIHAPLNHSFIAKPLEFPEVVPRIGECAVLKTVTAVAIGSAGSRVVFEGHQAGFAGVLFHDQNRYHTREDLSVNRGG